MSKFQEKDLVKAFADDKTRGEMFDKVVKTYTRQLYWIIRRMVLCHDDANDVLQNTFLKAWKGILTYKGDAQISTWLGQIAVNETLSFIESKKKNLGEAVSFEDVMVQNLKADEYFSGDELELKFQRALLTLPPRQRLVFNMKYYDEMKYEDMSEVLGVSVGGLKATYHHAVKKIKDFLCDES